MGVTIGDDAVKSGTNTNLLVVMRWRLSQKISLLDLTNCNRFKIKELENKYKILWDYWGTHLMLHTPSIYHGHKNVNLLGVCICRLDSIVMLRVF